MDLKSNRKSRAPWQLKQGFKPRPQITSPVPLYHTSEGTDVADSGESSTARATNQRTRKSSRRISIHASAVAPLAGFDVSAMPPLPLVAESGRRAGDNSDAVVLRSPALRDREEDPVAFINSELRDKDAGTIADFHKSLVIRKRKVETDIKEKINQNQKNILQLTDNLQATQQELVLLRESTKALYGILADLTESAQRRLDLELAEPDPAPASQAAARALGAKGRDRSSVMVLQKMWVTELQLLYKHVEGAQQVVHAVYGRHILGESGRWHEINVGNWKPLKAAHLFVLNDMLLVAGRQQARDRNGKALQLLHHWPLYMVKLETVEAPKTDKVKTFVISVAANGSRYYYQTDRADHHNKIVRAYNKGKAEVEQAQRTAEEDRRRNGSELGLDGKASAHGVTDEGLDKRQLCDSLRTSGYMDQAPLGSPDELLFHRRSGTHGNSADMLLKDLSVRVHSRNRSHDYTKLERRGANAEGPAFLFYDLKLLEDMLDEVDVNLAHKDYTSAVDRVRHIEGKLCAVVERLQTIDSSDAHVDELRLLVDVIRLKINGRRLNIQQGLCFELHQNIATLSSSCIATIIELYVSFDRLGEGMAALLAAWSAYLAQTVGRLISVAHGLTRVDIVNYLTNLVIVHVLIVKTAMAVHKACVAPAFANYCSETVDLSGFVAWCIAQVALLAELVKKHASGSLLVEDRGVWKAKDAVYYQELVLVVELQLALLKQDGLNADYLFTDILHCSALVT